MINFFYQLLRTARPRQWLKNFALFAPSLILGDITEISVINGGSGYANKWQPSNSLIKSTPH
jgi:hypothetical protein